MKSLKVFSAAILLSLASAAAVAGDGLWSNVTVVRILTYTSEGSSPSGFAYAVLSGNSSGGPSCATVTNQVAIDITTIGGGLAYSALEQAKATGATITVNGSGACYGGSATEYAAYVTN